MGPKTLKHTKLFRSFGLTNNRIKGFEILFLFIAIIKAKYFKLFIVLPTDHGVGGRRNRTENHVRGKPPLGEFWVMELSDNVVLHIFVLYSTI